MRTVLRTLFIVVVLWHPLLAMAQDAKQHAKGAVELGWRHFRNGDMDAALKQFNQALGLNPDFAPAYFGIAYVYSAQNKLALAIQNYRKSIEKDPSFSHSYSNLGLALLYSNEPKEALPMLQKAIDIDPRNGDAHVNIALYYFAIGDYSASWKHIHLAQDNKSPVKPEFLRDLKNKMPEPNQAVEPDRTKGLTAHLMPKRVAEADRSKGLQWGFMVSTTRTASLPAKDRPVFQTARELIAHFKTHPAEVQLNGIWVVLTNPAAYSSGELKVLDELKELCKTQQIPLFVAQGRDLPGGWQRVSDMGGAIHS